MISSTNTNADFLGKLFKEKRSDEHILTTSFATSPNKASGPEWSGRPGPCKDYDQENAYFAVSTFRYVDGKLRRKKDNFGRLFFGVLDDAGENDLKPTWRLRTSPDKVQIGCKLKIPVDDYEVARRFHEELGKGGLISADKSGNNPVRYVRLPAAINTKHSPPYSCKLEFFDSEVTYDFEDLIDEFGLDKKYILTGERQKISHSGTAMQEFHRPSDADLIEQIVTGQSYHEPILKMCARYAQWGMDDSSIVETMQKLMLQGTDRSERWKSRFNDIPRLVKGANKFKPINNGPWKDIRHGRNGIISPLTEVGDSEILESLVGDNVRFVPEEKSFIVFDDAWLRDDGNSRMTECAKGIYEVRVQEAQKLLASGGNPNEVKTVLDWAIKTRSLASLTKNIELLSKRPRVRLPITMLDSNPLVVGFDGGKKIIDLKTGAVRATKTGDYITKSLAISEIGKSSDAKRWKSFLNEIFLGDTQIVEWIRRWCGYILTGLNKEQILVFFYGQGRNGKSVLVKTLMDIMGDYGRSIASETLVSTQRNSQSASPDLARLAGARFVATQETEEGSRMAESLVKTMTGGDRILARFLNKDLFEFEPQFKLAISGNHQPIIRGNDYGVWRRIRLIPFLATFTDANDDKQLVEKLAAERPHIARWMVEAASDYLTSGLGPVPDRVANATSEYQEQMDTLGQWIGEECLLSDSKKETSVSELFFNYTRWCERSGLKRPTVQGFGRRMSERPGIQRIGDGRGRRYRGIALNSFPDFLILSQ